MKYLFVDDRRIMAYRRRTKNEIRPFACFYLRWIIKCYFAAEISRSNDQPVYDVPPFYADHVFDLMRGAWSPFFDFCRLFVTTVKLARWNGSASRERRCITVNCYRCIRSGFYRFFFFLHCVHEVAIEDVSRGFLSTSTIDKPWNNERFFSIELFLKLNSREETTIF